MFLRMASGTIDKFELATIMYKISSSMSEREIDKLLGVIDTNGDGLIDFKEFVGWLTDREGRSNSGQWWMDWEVWHSYITEAYVQRPLIETRMVSYVGLSSKSVHRFLGILLAFIPPLPTTAWSLIGRNCQPRKKWVSRTLLIGKWSISQKSGIPNNQLPTLLEELCESMQIIFDIDQLNQKGVENSQGAWGSEWFSHESCRCHPSNLYQEAGVPWLDQWEKGNLANGILLSDLVLDFR